MASAEKTQDPSPRRMSSGPSAKRTGSGPDHASQPFLLPRLTSESVKGRRWCR